MATFICRVMGPIFIIVAGWGFITHDQVLMFHVNPAHNWVHLISGALALWAGFSGERNAKTFSRVFGIIYGLVAVLGFAGVAPVVELLHLNMADNWLHMLIAALFIVVGFVQWPITLGVGSGLPRGPKTPPHPTPMG
jgi:Domain of unknown function (DUF4383)